MASSKKKVTILKIVSNVLLVYNAFCIIPVIGCFIAGYWYLFPLFLIPVYFILKLHFYAYREEHKAHEEWETEFRKTHTYMGADMYSEFWKNDESGEIIEI